MTGPTSALRVRVTRAECGAFGVHVWVVAPYFPGRPMTFETLRIGRRAVDLPLGGVLAASWAEAMRYALTGVPPIPVWTLPQYREWCGYGD